MAVKTFTNEQLTASDTNTYLANAGLVYITQVTVGTGVSSVNITNCLSSTYDNYRISFSNITGSSNGVAFTLKLLSGSTPTASGWYGNTFYVANAVAGALTNAVSSNTASAECGNITSTFKNAGTIELQQPYLSTQTYTNFMGADNNYMRMGAFVLNNSSSYDGIQFLPAGGTITGGTITVYGYRKA